MITAALEIAEETCTFPGCNTISDRQGFCLSHAKYFAGPKPKKQPISISKQTKPIAKKSKKRASIDRKDYAPKAKQFIIDNPVCNIQIPGFCQYQSQCVNHTKGKSTIELLLDKSFWQASCVPCNNEIERRDKWAKENGHKVSKFTPTS